MPSIVVLTDYTSPYQLELFDEIERLQPGSLEVFYLKSASPSRQWQLATFKHKGVLLDRETDGFAQAQKRFAEADFAVFNYYATREARDLIKLRSQRDKAWCFWGERPGFYSKFLGRVRRLWSLSALHQQRAPIWGIGSLATVAYRNEFGAFRSYVNLPYFSNLSRFEALPAKPQRQPNDPFTILYSGSLIPRKGVDLVAEAFAKLAVLHPQSRLRVMGSGNLEQKMRNSLHECTSQVEFTGFKDWSSLPGEYAAADVLCVPSRYDGWGLVVPEGLAAGLPVISTTETGSAAEFIRTGINGWLIPGDSEAAILDAMKAAVETAPPQLDKMRQAARLTVRAHTLEHGARKFIASADEAMADW